MFFGIFMMVASATAAVSVKSPILMILIACIGLPLSYGISLYGIKIM